MHRVVFIGIGRLLRRHGAGRNPNRLWRPPIPLAIQEPGNVARDSGIRRSEIVFEVACARNPLRGSAGNHEAAAVFIGLSENRVGPDQGVAEEAAGGAVPRQGPIGDAAVDDQQGRSRALRFAIQIGPDFGFENHDHGGAQAAEHAADYGAIVERREENTLGEARSSVDLPIARPARVVVERNTAASGSSERKRRMSSTADSTSPTETA